MSGFVYFIRSIDRVKIGFSTDPARRLVKICADSPYPCELIGQVDAATFGERELHERFAAHRTHGEWFVAADELLEFIAKCAPRPTVQQREPHTWFDAYLLETGETDAAFGGRAGLSQSQVSRLRRGWKPSWDAIVAIEKATGGKVKPNDWPRRVEAEDAA